MVAVQGSHYAPTPPNIYLHKTDSNILPLVNAHEHEIDEVPHYVTFSNPLQVHKTVYSESATGFKAGEFPSLPAKLLADTRVATVDKDHEQYDRCITLNCSYLSSNTIQN
jgi:hypothetical protein